MRTNAQSRFASVVFGGVLVPVVPEAMHEASRGPERGAVSAQKSPSRVFIVTNLTF